uniref:Uncharacterized protein n=1 Tax=Caenorhabditis japonica TaxID=281687 RepID=A0A8R1DLB5_CAEJA
MTANCRLKQSLPFLILWLVIFGIAFLVHLFFEDDETGKPVNKEKPLNGHLELLLPIENDYTVEDPVFGNLYEHQVPKLATISTKRR